MFKIEGVSINKTVESKYVKPLSIDFTLVRKHCIITAYAYLLGYLSIASEM